MIEIVLVWILILLQGVDSVTTMRALKLGATETNPVMRALMDRFGTTQALLVAKGVFIAFLLVVLILGGFSNWVAWLALLLLDAWYGWVVWTNYQTIKRRRR